MIKIQGLITGLLCLMPLSTSHAIPMMHPMPGLRAPSRVDDISIASLGASASDSTCWLGDIGDHCRGYMSGCTAEGVLVSRNVVSTHFLCLNLFCAFMSERGCICCLSVEARQTVLHSE